MTAQARPIPGKWYVIDRFGKRGEYVSGPFDTPAEAELDRREWNCAADYFVMNASAKLSIAEQVAATAKQLPE